MPQVRQHVPERSSGTSPTRPTGPSPGAGRGNAARAERIREAGVPPQEAGVTPQETGPTQAPQVATTPGAAGAAPVAGQAVAPAAAAGAIVLTRGADAVRAALPEQRSRVQVWAEFWEMPWNTAWVRLGEDAGAPAIVLDWPGVWGAAPVTRDVSSGRMQAFDARFAVKAARDSEGWGTLAADIQSRVEAILAGESNGLSSAAHSRLRGAIMNGWTTKPAAEQAKLLEELVTTNIARPMTVRERNGTARAAVTRTGPTEVTGHAFASGAADAYRYVLAFPDGQQVEIFLPKTKDPTRGYHTIEEIEEAVAYLPEPNRKVLRTVQLNPGANPQDAHWAVEYNQPNFRSYMTAGANGIVDVYPDSTTSTAPQSTVTGVMQHETGHVWSMRTWGNDTTQGKWLQWKAAMDSDRVPVSAYATNDIVEDVAETIQAYSSTKGAPAHEEYRRIVPARFAMLDAELA